MAKWQGLILSEHTEIVNEEKKTSRKINIEKEKQSVEIIYNLFKQQKYSELTFFVHLTLTVAR